MFTYRYRVFYLLANNKGCKIKVKSAFYIPPPNKQKTNNDFVKAAMLKHKTNKKIQKYKTNKKTDVVKVRRLV
jgi:hypothetical protein